MFKNKFRKFSSKLLVMVCLSLFLISLPLVLVQGEGAGWENSGGAGWEDEGGEKILNPLGTKSFTELINRIAKWIFTIAIPLATVMFLIGGFQFLISAGNEDKVTQAKKTMLWAAVGLAICIIGAGFTSLIENLLEVKK
jgi:hypothetical protein